MAFYPTTMPFYYPMPYPNQEFYPNPMYPGGNPGATHGSSPGMEMSPNRGAGGVFYEPTNNGKVPYGQGNSHGIMSQAQQGGMNMMNKQGFANRKDSADSGISDFSSNYSSRKSSWDHSRKSSSLSNASSVSRSEFMSSMDGELSTLDDVKEEEPYEDPDDDLCEKIVTQVEFYFSDANITKDKFLLKHVKRNKEGFVSLKLISSFKRVKNLTKDWRQVAEAIERKAGRLEVNDLKTKVRRLDALPEYDETTPSRTVVALNLPLERPTIEAVGGIFSACGDIVLVRILRPGNPIPADIKPFANKHPEMTAKVCALIEFERTEFALKAVRELNDMAPKEESKAESSEEGEEKEENTTPRPKMVVMELTAPPPKTTKNKEDRNKAKQFLASGGQAMNRSQPSFSVGQAITPTRRFSYAGHGQQQQQLHQQHGMMSPGSPGDGNQRNSFGNDDLGPRRRISLYHNMKFNPISEESSPPPPGRKISHPHEMGMNPNAPTFTMQQQQQQVQQYSQQRSGRYSRQLSQPMYSPPHHRAHPADIMMASGPNPMPTQQAAAHAAQVAHNAAMAAHAAFQQHSAVAAQAAIVAATGISAGPVPYVHHRRISSDNLASSGLALPPNVIRLPRGPDQKTRGFERWCKSRKNTYDSQSPAPQVSQTQVSEQKPRLGVHKRGSHAVAIVAPPKEEKSASKASQKKGEFSLESIPRELVKNDKVERKPETPELAKETVKPEPEKEESCSSISASVEPSAPPAEEGSLTDAQNLPVVNVPVVQGRIIIQANADSGSDSGNDSEAEAEAAAADIAEARAQPAVPPSFAANLSMDDGSERSR